jgi:hypothetical protein
MSTFVCPQIGGPHRLSLFLLLTAIPFLALCACGSPPTKSATVDAEAPEIDESPATQPLATESPGDSPPAQTPSEPIASPPAPAKSLTTEATEPAEPVETARPPVEPEAPTPLVDRKELTRRFRQAVVDWVAALDQDDRKKARSFLATEGDLKVLLPEPHLKIMRGHLLPQNKVVVDSLLNSAEGQKVELLRLGEGQVQLPEDGKSGLTVPVVINSLVEISIGDLPIALEFRRAFHDKAGWKVMEVIIRY